MKMISTRNALGVAAVAGIAFLAGRLLTPQPQLAVAAPMHDDQHDHDHAHGHGHDHEDGHGHGHGEMQVTERMMAMHMAGQTGPHHELLKPLIGTWEGVYKMRFEPGMPMFEFPSTVTRKWVLDGHYVREEVTSEMEGETFKGVGYIGYNNIDGVYEMTWMDNMSTGIMFMTGTIDPDRKVFVMRGSHRDPLTHQVVHHHGSMNLANPNRHTSVGYAYDGDGREYKQSEGVFERARE